MSGPPPFPADCSLRKHSYDVNSKTQQGSFFRKTKRRIDFFIDAVARQWCGGPDFPSLSRPARERWCFHRRQYRRRDKRFCSDLRSALAHRTLRDLPQCVFGPELLDLHADDFGESGGDFLCDASLIRGKIKTDKCHDEGPIRGFGAGPEYDLPDTRSSVG